MKATSDFAPFSFIRYALFITFVKGFIPAVLPNSFSTITGKLSVACLPRFLYFQTSPCLMRCLSSDRFWLYSLPASRFQEDLLGLTNSFAYWLSGEFRQVSLFCDGLNSPSAAYSRSFEDLRRAFRDENSQGPKAILLNHSLAGRFLFCFSSKTILPLGLAARLHTHPLPALVDLPHFLLTCRYSYPCVVTNSCLSQNSCYI